MQLSVPGLTDLVFSNSQSSHEFLLLPRSVYLSVLFVSQSSAQTTRACAWNICCFFAHIPEIPTYRVIVIFVTLVWEVMKSVLTNVSATANAYIEQ